MLPMQPPVRADRQEHAPRVYFMFDEVATERIEMSEELRPCPFCGSEYVYRGAENVIHCGQCGASEGIDWNTRPLEDAKDAEIKRLEAQLAEAGAALAGLGYTSSADDSDSYDSLIPDEYL